MSKPRPLASTSRHLLLLLAITSPWCRAAEPLNPFLHPVGRDGTLALEFQERIGHPHFWWPRTLVNYRIQFSASDAPPLDPTTWQLLDTQSQKPLAMQVSDTRVEQGRLVAATLSFFTDLPTSAKRSFLLKTRDLPPQSASPAALVSSETDAVILNSGKLKLRLPASRTLTPGSNAIPGPIMAVEDAGHWVGESSLESPQHAVEKITTEILDSGPLFARVRVSYQLAGNAGYSAVIKLGQGQEFAEFTESFQGLSPADKALFRFSWSGLKLTCRDGNEPIEVPKALYYRGEDPHFTGPGSVENPAEAFYYQLGHCAGDATICRTAANFSNPDTGALVGLCVLDGSKWDDGQYSIWASGASQRISFRLRKNQLEWLFPLTGQSRQTAFVKANGGSPENVELTRHFSDGTSADSVATAKANRGVPSGGDLVALINSRYGGMSLDVIKDWQLDYPEGRALPATHPLEAHKRFSKITASADAYSKAIWNEHESLHVEGNWYSPVSLRQFSQWIVPGFNRFRQELSPEMRRRITALLLFQSYLSAREEIHPMRHMLGGHPNFMADWKYPLMGAAYLFPEHPMAQEWADMYEKFVQLTGIFYTRPGVAAWEALGGRWTENLGTYNFAYIEPVTAANDLGILMDGRNRLAHAGMALHSTYLSGVVTAPVKMGVKGQLPTVEPGTALTPENGFQRIHPPQGAHSGKRPIPGCVELLGDALARFDPMAAEHLLWTSRRPEGSSRAHEGGAPPRTSTSAKPLGTNPHLRSAKYTGYGFVLRAAVDTPQEITVFLQQIDKGPNYRWGFGNEGGCGDIYYYAGGQSFSGHLTEDAGDRRVVDADLTCNTGVYKNATFRSIGMNDLTEPLYDLESAQFAEILPRQGPDAYAWPEYEARSVLLVGHDYIVVSDTVNNTARMAWNTVRGEDKMPLVHILRSADSYHINQVTDVIHHTTASESQRWDPYKSTSDRLALVTHREDLKMVSSKDPNFSVVDVPESRDYIYQQRSSFRAENSGRLFVGRVGVMREFKSGRVELNLIHGQSLGNAALELAVDQPDLGVSASFKADSDPAEITGRFASRTGGTMSLRFGHNFPSTARLYVDGRLQTLEKTNQTLSVKLPAGSGRWQLTCGDIAPMPPRILSSVAMADGATVSWEPVEGADSYQIQASSDGGSTWQSVGTSDKASFTLSGQKAPSRVHLRVIALHGKLASEPGDEYPVLISGKAVESPEGLRLELSTETVQASWGQVLGAREYRLYRREKSSAGSWQEVYRGPERLCVQKVPGVVPAFSDPGLEAQAMREPMKTAALYEYVVTAVDGVGESAHSSLTTTDPSCWRNWMPYSQPRYKRQSAYWLPPFVSPEEVPPAEYPR